jgi:hypothetical protein
MNTLRHAPHSPRYLAVVYSWHRKVLYFSLDGLPVRIVKLAGFIRFASRFVFGLARSSQYAGVNQVWKKYSPLFLVSS